MYRMRQSQKRHVRCLRLLCGNAGSGKEELLSGSSEKVVKIKMKKMTYILMISAVVFLGACGCGQATKPVFLPLQTEVSPEEMQPAIITAANTAADTPASTPIAADILMSTATITPTPTPKPTATVTPTPTPKPSATLTMVGDILLHTRIHTYSKQEDGSYNYDAVFAGLSEEISAADIALVNQEVVLGGKELGISGYPSFNAPKEAGDALVKAGFDVILHATNHALDKKAKGVRNTLKFWEENYPEIGVLGIHDSAEDQNEIYVTTINGIRIAVLNYTYGTNGIAMPGDMPYAVDMLKEAAVIEDIQQAKQLADFVIVAPHWGTEYRLTPDSSQKKWTKLFLEQGVDLVLGTHPHVIEPVEMLSRQESDEQMLVFYSIGNFVNWTSGAGKDVANRMVGGMPVVTIEMDEHGNAYIADYYIRAVVCHVEEKTNGITVYPLSEYTEELAAQNAIRSQDKNFSLEYCRELCNKVFGEIWR